MQGLSIIMEITSRGWIWPSPGTRRIGPSMLSLTIRIYFAATSTNDSFLGVAHKHISNLSHPLLRPLREKEEIVFLFLSQTESLLDSSRTGNLFFLVDT